MEYWSDGAMGQEETEKPRKQVPCPDFAPVLVPANTLVLLPIPIPFSTPIQQTSTSRRIAARDASPDE
jgi:hypothetical protein